MDLSLLTRTSDTEWRIEPRGHMRVPGVIYGSESLVADMDAKVYEQVANVATLPGIVRASYAMSDAHWGYGFPIGGVAAFDPDRGGVVSAGGVGFDISCGVRLLSTGLTTAALDPIKKRLADELSRSVPSGVGSVGRLHLDDAEMSAMLTDGARWAVARGYGTNADLDRIEEGGCMPGAAPDEVSARAKQRQRDEMGTLGSGNHYLEVQRVAAVFDAAAADAYALHQGDVVVSVHCGSRGLGHQIGNEFLRSMVLAARGFGIELPDRELACAPIESPLGRAYLGAMRAAINCAFGPGHPALAPVFASVGQPVLIGGTMGTASYVLAGTADGLTRAFGSSCHGAGRSMSRHQAAREWRGRQLIDELAHRGILVRSPSPRGVAEEAPGAYKEVTAGARGADNPARADSPEHETAAGRAGTYFAPRLFSGTRHGGRHCG